MQDKSKSKSMGGRLDYWKRGLILGIAAGALSAAMILIGILGGFTTATHPILARILFNGVTGIGYDMGAWFVGLFGCYTSPCVLGAAFVSVVIYGLVGTLVGFALQKTHS